MPVRFDAAENLYRIQSVGISTLTARVTARLHSDRAQNGIFWIVFNGTATDGFAIAVNSSRTAGILRFTGGTPTFAAGSVTLAVDRIYDLALVKSGNNYTLYVDGQQALTTTSAHSFTDAGYMIGNADFWADCSVSHARIWQAALSQSEIQAEDASGAPVRTSNLFSAHELIASLTADTSGNGHTLTATGTPTLAGDDPIGTGAASITEDRDTTSAAGTVSSTAATGTANITEAADTATGAGTVLVSGQASITEDADSATGAGTVEYPAITGNGSVTEAADTANAAGAVLVTGQADITHAADSSAASGTVTSLPATGQADVTEARDVTTAAGTVKDPDENGSIEISIALAFSVEISARGACSVELAQAERQVMIYDSVL